MKCRTPPRAQALDTAATWITETYERSDDESPATTQKKHTVCDTVTNALFWIEIFIYFDENEDAKEAVPTECALEMLGDDSSFDRTTTVDIVVRATPPPSWLPDWFLDRLPRPPHEQPMSPNVRRARAGVPSSETRDARLERQKYPKVHVSPSSRSTTSPSASGSTWSTS